MSEWNSFDRAINGLLCEEPFYGYIIAQMNKIRTERIPTLGVALRRSKIELLWNAKFFETLQKMDHKKAILKHEILHIILQHIVRGSEWADHNRGNIAADLVVNQIVGEDKLPKDMEHKGAYLSEYQEKFGQDKFPPNETMDFYYKALRKLTDDELGVVKHFWVIAGGAGEGDGEDEEGDGLGKIKVIGQGDLSEGEKVLIEAQAREMVERSKVQSGDAWGNLPGNLRALLDELFAKQKPQLPWKVILKRFVAKANKSKINFTMKRVSKRYGVRPGLKKDQKLHLLLALDTSGSVNDEQFVTFFNELDGISRMGTQITVVDCDHALQNVYPYRPGMSISRTGYGGTAFDPVFRWINENKKHREIDAVIYCTDGWASEPQERVRVPVLFVLTTDHAEVPGFKNLVLPEC